MPSRLLLEIMFFFAQTLAPSKFNTNPDPSLPLMLLSSNQALTLLAKTRPSLLLSRMSLLIMDKRRFLEKIPAKKSLWHKIDARKNARHHPAHSRVCYINKITREITRGIAMFYGVKARGRTPLKAPTNICL